MDLKTALYLLGQLNQETKDCRPLSFMFSLSRRSWPRLHHTYDGETLQTNMGICAYTYAEGEKKSKPKPKPPINRKGQSSRRLVY